MKLSDNIKASMALNCISQDQLCNMIGMSRSKMSRCMTGKQEFSIEELKAIASALNTDIPDYIPGLSPYKKVMNQIKIMEEIRDSLKAYSEIIGTGSCLNCNKKDACEYVPIPGQPLRYNCPHYEGLTYPIDTENP